MKLVESAPPQDFQLCSDHSRRLGPLCCERCGAFLCEECLFQTAFTPFCHSCISLRPHKLPQNYRSPVTISQVAFRFFNMGFVTAFMMATFISFMVSFEGGFQNGVSFFGIGFALIFVVSLLVGSVVLIYTVLVSPLRARKLAKRRAAAMALLKTHCLAVTEVSFGPNHCFRCETEHPYGADRLCEDCDRAFGASLCQFDPAPAGIESPPPWTLQSRLLIGLLIPWILIIDLFLAFIPAPARPIFANWPIIPVAFIAATLFLVFRLHARILSAMALAPLSELYRSFYVGDRKTAES